MLIKGFDIMQTEEKTKKVFKTYFICLRHEEFTRNYRKLKSHIKHNEEDAIIIIHQYQNTLIDQTDCKWSVYVS